MLAAGEGKPAYPPSWRNAPRWGRQGVAQGVPALVKTPQRAYSGGVLIDQLTAGSRLATFQGSQNRSRWFPSFVPLQASLDWTFVLDQLIEGPCTQRQVAAPLQVVTRAILRQPGLWAAARRFESKKPEDAMGPFFSRGNFPL